MLEQIKIKSQIISLFIECLTNNNSIYTSFVQGLIFFNDKIIKRQIQL